MQNHLVPEKRQDKNGRLVTKHVRSDNNANAVSKPLPEPSLPVTPVDEQCPSRFDFDAVCARNVAYANRKSSTVMTPDDFNDMHLFMERALEEEGPHDETRGFTANEIIKNGSLNGIRTINYFYGRAYGTHRLSIDVWAEGVENGIFEQDKDYSLDEEDKKYYRYILDAVATITEDINSWEVTRQDMREVAAAYGKTNGNVDVEVLRDMWKQRGGINAAAYMEYLANHRAIRDGAL